MKFENFFDKMDSVQGSRNRDKWLALKPDWFVRAKDPVLSGWGGAPDTSYVFVLCNTPHDAERVARGLQKDRMKYITIGLISELSSLTKKSGCHYTLYFAPDTYWWKQDGINDNNRDEYYNDRLSGENKMYGKNTHPVSHPKKCFCYLKDAYKKML